MDKIRSEKKTKKFCKDIDSNRWNKIRNSENEYPSLSVVRRYVLEEEKRVAINFSNLKTALQKRRDINISQLELNLEWFLTWRIKLIVYRTCLWCDGVEISEVKSFKDLNFFLSAETWLGPESNVNKEYKCKVIGTISVNKTFDKLKKYSLEIDYRKDKIYLVK